MLSGKTVYAKLVDNNGVFDWEFSSVKPKDNFLEFEKLTRLRQFEIAEASKDETGAAFNDAFDSVVKDGNSKMKKENIGADDAYTLLTKYLEASVLTDEDKRNFL